MVAGEAGDVLGEVALLISQLFRLLNGILKVAGGVPVITLFFLIAVRPLLSFSVRLETCEPLKVHQEWC